MYNAYEYQDENEAQGHANKPEEDRHGIVSFLATHDREENHAECGKFHSRNRGQIRLATSSSITSVAPPPIDCTRASRAIRSMALSRM
jgi:hypothetical protein